MREIKFRVWDEIEKSMMFVSRLNMYCDKAFPSEVKSYCNSDLEYGWAGEEAHIMQYTGLKDKNGVEIYEGDIVLYNTISNIETCVIRYSQECSYLAYPVQFPNCAGYRLTRDVIGMREYSEKTGKVEVIGNIYENSELLGEE